MSKVKQYRKKPVVIDAMQFGVNVPEQTAASKWVEDNGGELRLIDGAVEKGDFADNYKWHWEYGLISTLEGAMRVNIGDYIIKGVQGEFYPCKPDIFAMTYELAQPESEQ